ncbi:hypothetical protein KEM09_07630 [Carboxylicivirga mesophila]|uniref:Uncharacterized protein n=1 Tax=Carboxylicivirga mesophila TaxID=1166478 RepID=A0ABS5K8F0_9BACT|nr:hypothetical protein [Carboxylicivirga mesophila]MBS2211265.1 hypothetical protein [Carboxylicivirga mesophila]
MKLGSFIGIVTLKVLMTRQTCTYNEIDGISFLSALLGDSINQKRHDYMYWEFNEGKGPVQLIRKGDWKLLRFVLNNKIELYHMYSDVSECVEVSDNHPEKCQELLNLMNNARTGHPQFPLTKRNPYKKKK